jgi:hypothetical protein
MADKKISALTSATTPLAGTEVLPIVQSSTTVKVSVANLTVGQDVALKTVTATAAATQDGVQLAGRAGGTGSYIATITPTTLSASRTVTLPDANTSIPVATQILTYSGPTAARTITLPDANFTAARIDAAQSFTGDQTLSTGNLVVSNGKGVDFSATPGTGTSELFADYEEGTWTPIDGSGAGLTYSSATGNYTKVGRTVTVVFNVVYPSTASASAARIGGLPFTAANINNGRNVGCFNINTSAQAVQPSVVTNATTFAALKVAAGTSATNVELSLATLQGGITYFV